MTRTRVAIAVIVACWLGVAACGGGGEVTKAEYGDQLRSAMADVEDAYGSAGSGNDTSAAQVVGRLRTVQVGLRDAANRLDEITPPADLAAAHDDLVAGVRDMADAVDLRIEAEEVAASDPAKARSLARRFASDSAFEDVQDAAARIEEAGVDAGL